MVCGDRDQHLMLAVPLISSVRVRTAVVGLQEPLARTLDAKTRRGISLAVSEAQFLLTNLMNDVADTDIDFSPPTAHAEIRSAESGWGRS